MCDFFVCFILFLVYIIKKKMYIVYTPQNSVSLCFCFIDEQRVKKDARR